MKNLKKYSDFLGEAAKPTVYFPAPKAADVESVDSLVAFLEKNNKQGLLVKKNDERSSILTGTATIYFNQKAGDQVSRSSLNYVCFDVKDGKLQFVWASGNRLDELAKRLKLRLNHSMSYAGFYNIQAKENPVEIKPKELNEIVTMCVDGWNSYVGSYREFYKGWSNPD